jgi:hypothetical protein
MTIVVNNFTEFFNLIKSVGLESQPPYANFVKTVDKYVSLCGCDNAARKEVERVASKRLYESIAASEIGSKIPMIKERRNAKEIKFIADGRLFAKY